MKLRKKLAQFIAIAVIGMMSVTSFASELPVLTLEQAVKSALSADAAQQEATDADILSANMYLLETEDVSSGTYQSNYYNKLNKEQSMKYHKDAVAYQATKLYNTITLLEQQVAFCDEKLALQEKLYSQAQLKYNKGLVSKLEFEKAQSTIEEQRTAKDKLQAQLDESRANFKQLVKYDTTRYSLEENFEVEFYEYSGNIQYFFDSAVEEMLQYQKKSVEASASYTVNDQFKKGDHSATTYYSGKASVAQAKSQLESTKDSYLSALNSTYSSLQSTKQSIKELEVVVQDLEKTLEAQKLKLEKGLVSQIEIDQAELTLREQKLNLIQLKVNYNSLKDAVKKPWVSFY